MYRLLYFVVFAACSAHPGGRADAVGLSDRPRVPSDGPLPVPDGPPCPIGDPNEPMMLQVYHFDRDMSPVMTAAGASVPLVQPQQGGWILAIGARATNLDGCHVTITTSLHDVCGDSVVNVDRRPTRFDSTGDGWGLSEFVYAGNLSVCPQPAALRDLHDQPYVIEVELEDRTDHHASASVVVTPTCPDPDPSEECLCQCDHNYQLGQCPAVGADAGPRSCDAGG